MTLTPRHSPAAAAAEAVRILVLPGVPSGNDSTGVVATVNRYSASSSSARIAWARPSAVRAPPKIVSAGWDAPKSGVQVHGIGAKSLRIVTTTARALVATIKIKVSRS
jgi:hypothetical protein